MCYKKSILLVIFLLFLKLNLFASFKDIQNLTKEISSEIIKSTDIKGVSVAVLPFENSQGEITELGQLITDGLINEWTKTKQFTVLDRNYISRLMGEIKLSLVGIVDSKTASQLGKMSGAKFVLTGSLKSYGEKKIIVSAKLLDVQQAMIITSSEKVLKLDKEMKKLFEKKASVDSIVGGLMPETKITDDAVFLNQTDETGCQWLESKAIVPSGKNSTVARSLAISVARHKSVMKILGKTSRNIPEFNEEIPQSSIEVFLNTSKNGRILKEKILKDEALKDKYLVEIQVCLIPLRKSADKDFRIDMILNQKKFFQAQEARIILTTNRNGYIYIFSVDFENNAIKIFPIPGASNNKIQADKPFIFPNEEHEKSGIKLVAEIPEGSQSSIETLRAIAVKQDLGNILDDVKTYPEIIQKLEDSGLDWTEDIKIFTIFKK